MVSHHIHSHPAEDLEHVLRMIRVGKLTGSITINFSQGTPSGSLEWKEKLKSKSDSGSNPSSPMLSLVKD